MILKSDQVLNMTGWDLMELLSDGPGIDVNQVYTFTSEAPDGRQRDWKAEMTLGRGRQSGKSYVHLWTNIVRRIVTPDGEDTGSRMPDVIRVRGVSTAKIGTYQEM